VLVCPLWTGGKEELDSELHELDPSVESGGVTGVPPTGISATGIPPSGIAIDGDGIAKWLPAGCGDAIWLPLEEQIRPVATLPSLRKVEATGWRCPEIEIWPVEPRVALLLRRGGVPALEVCPAEPRVGPPDRRVALPSLRREEAAALGVRPVETRGAAWAVLRRVLAAATVGAARLLQDVATEWLGTALAALAGLRREVAAAAARSNKTSNGSEKPLFTQPFRPEPPLFTPESPPLTPEPPPPPPLPLPTPPPLLPSSANAPFSDEDTPFSSATALFISGENVPFSPPAPLPPPEISWGAA